MNKPALLVVAMIMILIVSGTALTLLFSNTSHQYSISFDANGGNPEIQILTTNKDGKLSSLPNDPEYGEYPFDGWYTERTGGQIVNTSTIFFKDTTVYAHWSTAINTFTFKSEGQNYILTGIDNLVCLDVKIPSSYSDAPVIGVGECAFMDSPISSVSIPNSITRIESKAFANCENLRTVTFNDNICCLFNKIPCGFPTGVSIQEDSFDNT